MTKELSSSETDRKETELFRVLDVLKADEKSPLPLVLAGTLATRGVLRWFNDTPRNRTNEVQKALDEGLRVESVTIRDGRQLLVISDVEPIPEGNQIMIDGRKIVIGVDGAEIPAADLLVPGDVIEISSEGQDLHLRLVDLADFT